MKHIKLFENFHGKIENKFAFIVKNDEIDTSDYQVIYYEAIENGGITEDIKEALAGLVLVTNFDSESKLTYSINVPYELIDKNKVNGLYYNLEKDSELYNYLLEHNSKLEL